MNIKEKALDLGLKLPDPPQTAGDYKRFMIGGKIACISGQLPMHDGRMIYQGKLGSDLTLEEGIKAAELCAINILSQIALIEETYTVRQILRIEGYINSEPFFSHHAKVIDGTSKVLKSVLGDQAGHARSVIGCSNLPMDAAVEVVTTLEID